VVLGLLLLGGGGGMRAPEVPKKLMCDAQNIRFKADKNDISLFLSDDFRRG
jgi:hypothetical protein